MAIAVLSLWMLALLAPLHQTAVLLRALAETGHQLPAGWSVCVTLAGDSADQGDGADRATTVCPAQALTKTEIALPAADVVLIAFRPAQFSYVAQPVLPVHPARAPPLPVQARAPPSLT